MAEQPVTTDLPGLEAPLAEAPVTSNAGSIPHYWQALWALTLKDLTAEWRNRQLVTAMLVFALLVILIFNFALELDANARTNVAAGVLWVTFIFAATLGLNRAFAPEVDRGSLDGLLLAPVDRSALFFAKLISTLVFIFAVEIIVVPVFIVLYNLPLFNGMFILVVVLGTLGYVSVGTLLAALSVRIRAREVMLPVLLFPITVPVILASVKASTEILAGSEWGKYSAAFGLIVAYDIVFIALAIMLFDYLVED